MEKEQAAGCSLNCVLFGNNLFNPAAHIILRFFFKKGYGSTLSHPLKEYWTVESPSGIMHSLTYIYFTSEDSKETYCLYLHKTDLNLAFLHYTLQNFSTS